MKKFTFVRRSTYQRLDVTWVKLYIYDTNGTEYFCLYPKGYDFNVSATIIDTTRNVMCYDTDVRDFFKWIAETNPVALEDTV